MPYVEKVEAKLNELRPHSSGGVSSLDKGVDSDRTLAECPDIVTGSSAMREILTMAERVAPSDLNILLTGATGTGKDVLARYIHYHSNRPGRFVSVNASALPDSLVESELFGHTKGAFTGANTEKEGLFEAAHEGTFFLDEIADASLSFQAKLLEVIENHAVRRLGETTSRKVSFRLIAATNQDLSSRINNRHFRADLFHRLNQLEMHLPGLDERAGDFLPLVEYFLRTSGIDPSEDGIRGHIERLAEKLSQRAWPGNVRQLRAEVNRLVVLSSRDVSRMVELVEETSLPAEDRAVLSALNEADGNQAEAARKLGIPESTLRYRLKKTRGKKC